MKKIVRLGDVLKTAAGGTPLKSKKNYYKDGKIKWLLSGAINQKEIFECNTTITDEGLKNSSAKIFPINTVLVAMYGATAGQVGILRIPAATNQAVCGIYPSDNYLPEYLFYYLLNYKKTLLLETSGVAQPNLSQIKIKNIPLPIISIVEQQRIVAKLDAAFAEIDKIIENTNKKIENINAFFENYLVKCFFNKKYKQAKLKDICTATQGIQISKSNQIKSFKKGYLRYLYISDFSNDKNIKYIENKHPKKIVKRSDIIVVNTGASAGNIFRGIEGILSNNLFKVSANKKLIDKDFLYYFVISKLFKNFQKKIMRGTANPHMGHENFLKTPLNLPNLDEQKQIISKVFQLENNVKTLNQIYLNKIDTLSQLKLNFLFFNLNNIKAT